MKEQNSTKIRLDKWLWAARFFKTRSLATEAITGGKVHLNKQRVKPAKEVKIGDELAIRKGKMTFTIIVKALSIQRRSAPEAQLLYEETPESLLLREKPATSQEGTISRPRGLGRPTKKERRDIERFKGN